MVEEMEGLVLLVVDPNMLALVEAVLQMSDMEEPHWPTE